MLYVGEVVQLGQLDCLKARFTLHSSVDFRRKIQGHLFELRANIPILYQSWVNTPEGELKNVRKKLFVGPI